MPRVDSVKLDDKNEIVMARWGSRKTGDEFDHNVVRVPDSQLGNTPIKHSIQQMQQQEEINEYDRQIKLMEQQNQQQTQSQSRGRTM